MSLEKQIIQLEQEGIGAFSLVSITIILLILVCKQKSTPIMYICGIKHLLPSYFKKLYIISASAQDISASTPKISTNKQKFKQLKTKFSQ